MAGTLLPGAWATRPGFKTSSCSEVLLDIPARDMWDPRDRHGYSGESAFQSSLLYFGNYVSQASIREASGGDQLVIGINDQFAAANLGLAFEAFNSDDGGDGDDDEHKREDDGESSHHTEAFLHFTGRHLRRGHPVLASGHLRVDNEHATSEHVMPIIGFNKGPRNASDSRHRRHRRHRRHERRERRERLGHTERVEHRDRRWRQERRRERRERADSPPSGESAPASAASLTFSTRQIPSPMTPIDSVFRNSEQCTVTEVSGAAPDAVFCLPTVASRVIALTGNADPEEELYRTILSTEACGEADWRNTPPEDEDERSSSSLTTAYTATVYGLTEGKRYALLEFDSPDALNDSRGFIALSYAARTDFTAAADSHAVAVAIRDNEDRYFRAVALDDDEEDAAAQSNLDGAGRPDHHHRRRRHHRHRRILGMTRTVFAVVCSVVGAVILLSLAAMIYVFRSRGLCCFAKRGGAPGAVVLANPAPAVVAAGGSAVPSAYSINALDADAVGVPEYVPSGPYHQMP